MLRKLFSPDTSQAASPQEGDVYKILQIHDKQFELRYGYYAACEREDPDFDPMPIYPDFLENPCFTSEGFPFVTKMQDCCQHYTGGSSCSCECAECGYYSHGDDLIGICVCPERRQTAAEGADAWKSTAPK